MVSDANAARSDEEHKAALVDVYSAFGDVMATDEVFVCFPAGRPGV